MARPVFYACAANQEAAFWSRDPSCTVLENFLKQAGMAAKPFLQDEIIPATEWGTHLKASICFPFTLS